MRRISKLDGGSTHLSRRDFLTRAVAVGATATSLAPILAACSSGGGAEKPSKGSGGSAVPVKVNPMPPSFIPKPSSEIVMPITKTLTDEPVTLRVVAAQNPLVTDFDNNVFTRWLEQKTNVHVEWSILPGTSSDATTKLNAMVASGDLPDVIFGILNQSQVALYGAQSIFTPLGDLIDQHAVRLQKAFENYPDFRRVWTAPGGQIFVMPNLGDCYHCSMSQKLWIYQPWLDKLGLDMPTTTDEYEEVLKAFKTGDPNGNGKADEIPLTASPNLWHGTLDEYFMNSFLYAPAQPWLVLNDGRVDAVYNKPEWREGLEYLSRLYSQGLIDPQAFVQTSDQIQQAGNNPSAVILGSVASGSVNSFVNPVQEKGARWTGYVAVPPLKGPNGVGYAAYSPYTAFTSLQGAVITRACENPELAVQWVDCLYDRYTTYLSEASGPWRWAEQGEVDVGGNQAVAKRLAGFGSKPDNKSWHQTGPTYRSHYFWESEVVDPNLLNDQAVLWLETQKKYEPHKQPKEWIMPPLAMGPEQASVIAEKEKTLTDLVKRMLVEFIKKGNASSGWNTYVDNLDKIGLPLYLKTYQDAYDAQYG